MATYNLAFVLKNDAAAAADEYLLVKQNPPPKFGDEEYDSYVDSDLWDLPSTKLDLFEGESSDARIVVEEGMESLLERIDLRKFDVASAIQRVLGQLGFEAGDWGEWRFLKLVEEAEFGPGFLVHTVYLMGKLMSGNHSLSDTITTAEHCKWMSIQDCLGWLLDVTPSSDRVGPLVVAGLISETRKSSSQKVHTTVQYQEYPPGVIIVPMKSRTTKPFKTTNLVIFAPESILSNCGEHSFVACGDALIVDPGCQADSHEELFRLVAALPRKLIVFVTHHHLDHVEGLSIVQKCNPEATLLVHENTMRRIRKGDWSLGYTSVSGGEDICIGGQRLNVIFAPGHTDGHVALLHVNTQALIVGDHCVGQGSAVLDFSAGGNMADYFQSTYKFIEIKPHVLIPMHGRVNMWPKHMLCGYLRNRRNREASILKAIENGARTLMDIVADVYGEVDRSLWIHASSNVRLHVEHLAERNKLPREFLVQKFRRTCGLHFLSRWLWEYLTSRFASRNKRPIVLELIAAVAVVSFAVLYTVRNKPNLSQYQYNV